LLRDDDTSAGQPDHPLSPFVAQTPAMHELHCTSRRCRHRHARGGHRPSDPDIVTIQRAVQQDKLSESGSLGDEC
jgi:hypothetical protein